VKVVIAGGSGFLGRALAEHLVGRRHDVVILTRSGHVSRATGSSIVLWDPDGTAGTGGWAREIDGAGAIVNLAGAGIADQRWSRRRKHELRDSRVKSTRSLTAAVRAASTKPSVFIQASGVGFYGNAGDEIIDESFPPGDDFLAQLCVGWEAEAHPVTALGCRLVIIRNGIALARSGGALKKLMPPFQFFVGGPIATGRQYFSWIHRADWVALVTWALETPTVSGVLNGTAPTPVTNAEFSRAVGRAMHRPSWLPVPAFALRIMVGQLADHGLITGQRVVPKRAMAEGFPFQYPEIGAAVEAAITQ